MPKALSTSVVRVTRFQTSVCVKKAVMPKGVEHIVFRDSVGNVLPREEGRDAERR